MKCHGRKRRRHRGLYCSSKTITITLNDRSSHMYQILSPTGPSRMLRSCCVWSAGSRAACTDQCSLRTAESPFLQSRDGQHLDICTKYRGIMREKIYDNIYTNFFINQSINQSHSWWHAICQFERNESQAWTSFVSRSRMKVYNRPHLKFFLLF